MDWYNECRRLLDSNDTPKCAPLLNALDMVRAGNTAEAAEELSSLEENQRFLCTALVEIEAVKAGCSGPDIELLGKRLTFDIPVNSVKLHDVMGMELKRTWASSVGPAVSPKYIADRDGYDYGQSLMKIVISHICNTSNHISAIPYAAYLHRFFCEDNARIWSLIASGLADSPERECALINAAQAGSNRPMIQNGGEEAAANAEAIIGFCKIGLEVTHPAVELVRKSFKALSRHRAEKDVRSYGVMVSAVASALHAADCCDQGWYDFAEEMIGFIWSDELKEKPRAALLLAGVKLGHSAKADLVTKARQLSDEGDAEQVIRAYAENHRIVNEYEMLVEQRQQGMDVSGKVKELLEPKSFGDRNIIRFENGCRLCLPDSELEDLLALVDDKNKKEALVKGAAIGFHNERDRAFSYLVRGYPEGDTYGSSTKYVLDLLTPEMLVNAEQYFAAQARFETLALIAGKYMSEGNTDAAARVIGQLGKSRTDSEWVPRYRRGRGTSLPFIVEPEEISPLTATPTEVKAAIKGIASAAELYGLALRVRHDSTLLEVVVKAARMKKFAKKKECVVDIIQILLLANLLEEAVLHLDRLSVLRSSFRDAPPLVQSVGNITAYLLDHAEEVTLDHIHLLAQLLQKVHPQLLCHEVCQLARLSLRLSEPLLQEGMAVVKRLSESVFRFDGDQSFLLLGFGFGAFDVGKAEMGGSYLKQGVDATKQDNCYVERSQQWIIKQFVAARQRIPYDVWARVTMDALIAGALVYDKPLVFVESSVRYLWCAGEVSLINRLLESGKLPTLLQEEFTRSIWADIEHAPDPLSILTISKPDLDAPKAIKLEYARAVAQALELEGNPQSEDLSRLIGECSVKPMEPEKQAGIR